MTISIIVFVIAALLLVAVIAEKVSQKWVNVFVLILILVLAASGAGWIRV